MQTTQSLPPKNVHLYDGDFLVWDINIPTILKMHYNALDGHWSITGDNIDYIIKLYNPYTSLTESQVNFSPTSKTSNNVCKCDIMILMQSGCQCNSIDKKDIKGIKFMLYKDKIHFMTCEKHIKGYGFIICPYSEDDIYDKILEYLNSKGDYKYIKYGLSEEFIDRSDIYGFHCFRNSECPSCDIPYGDLNYYLTIYYQDK